MTGVTNRTTSTAEGVVVTRLTLRRDVHLATSVHQTIQTFADADERHCGTGGRGAGRQCRRTTAMLLSDSALTTSFR